MVQAPGNTTWIKHKYIYIYIYIEKYFKDYGKWKSSYFKYKSVSDITIYKS